MHEMLFLVFKSKVRQDVFFDTPLSETNFLDIYN